MDVDKLNTSQQDEKILLQRYKYVFLCLCIRV